MATAVEPPATQPGAPASEREARDVAEAARETEWTHPSFVGELFLGRYRLDLIHPHPRPDPDEIARAEPFMAKLRALVERLDSEAIDRTGQIPDAVIDELRAMGAFGIKIPRDYGGLGLSPLAYVRAMELVTSEGWLAHRAAVGIAVDRRATAARAVRDRRAETSLLPTTRSRGDLGVRADGSGCGI